MRKTGNLYSEQFCYHEVPEKLDPFDEAAFAASPMDFFVVCTDVKTGEPIYHKCRKGDAEDVLWMEASASMPLAAKDRQDRPLRPAGRRRGGLHPGAVL